ncbi:MAG TPA: aconitase family protein [bacterium]|nr:aconitase family protein [bacterium]
MGLTVVEKIFKNHLIDPKEEVKPGNIVWISIDWRTARDFGGANVVNNLEKSFKPPLIHDKKKTMFTFDCNAPANTIPYAVNQHRCRIFARKEGLDVHDVDAGIGSHILIDHYAKPGMIAVGTDSHFNIMGAISCFGQGMGDIDIAYIMKTGRTWFEVPESIKVTFKGKRRPNIAAKDIVLFLLKKFGSSGLLGTSVELYGPEIEKLTIDERITVASMGTEMGVITLLMPVTEITADADAHYREVHELSFDDITEPLVAAPPYPHNIKTISEVAGKKVDTVFIGSCTNGRISDFAKVAALVKGKKIQTVGYIVPATREIYGKMLADGIVQTLFDAGFLVSNPGCGGCAAGQIGMTGKGEVMVSTSNRNFAGKQGDGEIYLASPETAARAALTGELSAG